MYYCVMCDVLQGGGAAPGPGLDRRGGDGGGGGPAPQLQVQYSTEYSTVQYSNAPQLQGQSELPGRGEAAAQRALDQGRDPHRGGGHQVPRQHLQGETHWVAFILYLVPTQGSSFIS